MNSENSLTSHFPLTLLFLVTTLYGCGVAHVRTDVASSDLHQYDKVFISEVKVQSQEAAAQDNAVLQTQMDEWEVFARGELEDYVNDSHYQLINQPPAITEKALIINLDIDLTYGNRALRYWIGFGAGKGGVDSVLTAIDSETGDEKFRATAESDLSVGAFGGDMEAILKQNIRELVDQYPRRADKDR
jgi:hypothetical protein